MSNLEPRELRRAWAVRAVALATAVYGAAITVSPKVLARPCGLMSAETVPPQIAALIRSIGVRDIASAAALALASPGTSMAGLTAARVVSDVADAVWLSSVAPPRQRAKVRTVTSGWAVLQLVVVFLNGRRSRSRDVAR